MLRQSVFPFLLLLFIFTGFHSKAHLRAKSSDSSSINSIKFLGEYDIAHNMLFKGTVVGGLSGIDYDSASGLFYMICDDRSAINPARFYTAQIKITKDLKPVVQFKDVVTLLQENGSAYPGIAQDPVHTPDPEALRYNASNNTLVWTSEGERIISSDKKILEDPAIIIMDKKGKRLDTFPIPNQLHMHETDEGPRRNGVFEGLCFAENNRTMFVSVEEPLYEDGPRANLKDTATWTRIIKYDVASKKVVAQYAYHLDPIALPSIPEDAFKVNGISDIMTISHDKLLVIERSYSTGHLSCTIRVYEADLQNATNIMNISSLQKDQPKEVVKKRLLLNMDSLGIFIDNIEGVTFGPTLPNGNKTLIFVADNNFSAIEKTQFLLFEIMQF